jgi:hypothetical protein
VTTSRGGAAANFSSAVARFANKLAQASKRKTQPSLKSGATTALDSQKRDTATDRFHGIEMKHHERNSD